MRVALLADIHGNAAALKAVLDAARVQGVDRILFAGDCVGYYYAPERCLELLADWDVTSVRGNHEDLLEQMLADPARTEGIHQHYGSGLATAARVLSASQRAFLAALPLRARLDLDGTSITLCHGAPWDADQYVYPNAGAELLARCAAEGTDYVVMGHTHYAFTAQSGATVLVNPGSVGQPRDRKPGAAWGLLDTTTREYQPRLETYDVDAVIRQTRAIDPHLPYLWEVLVRQ
jgi:putative phosphoesterase